jgi:hypothetical protein
MREAGHFLPNAAHRLLEDISIWLWIAGTWIHFARRRDMHPAFGRKAAKAPVGFRNGENPRAFGREDKTTQLGVI